MTALADIHGEELVPEREQDDFATLAAWYGNFGFFEHFRKVVLSQCRELVRAAKAVSGEKVTEARLDDMSRLHPSYLDFLRTHLLGRQKYEEEFRKMGGI